jgi:hexosaminidase
MMFPRLLAFAEAVWSPPAVRNYGDFRRRLPYQLGRLDKQDVRYRIPEPEGLKDFYTTSQHLAVVALSPHLPGAQMFYTLDGSEPTDESTLYRDPLQIALALEKPVSLKLVVVTPQGRRSVVYDATFLRRAYLEAKRIDAQPKLAFALYDGKFTSVRDIGRGVKVAKGFAGSLDLQQFDRSVNYAVQFDGFVKVASDDFYQFVVNSDDGAVLEIDDEVVIDNDGNHAPRVIAGHIPLRRGLHKFRLRYFQAEGGSSLDVSWAGSSGPLQPLEGSAIWH